MSSFYGGGGIHQGGSGGSGGVGISNVIINASRRLIIYFTDGSQRDLGVIDGATFTPDIVAGVLSWANNRGLENPEPYDFAALIKELSSQKWIPVDAIDEEEDGSLSPAPMYVWEPII